MYSLSHLKAFLILIFVTKKKKCIDDNFFALLSRR